MDRVKVYYSNYLKSQGVEEDIIEKSFYAIEVTLYEITKLILIFFVFAFLGEINSFGIILLSVLLIRKNLGGIHCSTQIGCLCASASVFFFVYIMGSQFHFTNIQSLCICIVAIGVMLKKAPIPSEQRPQYTKEQRRKFKTRGAFMVLVLYTISILCPKISGFILWAIIVQLIEAVWIAKIFTKRRKDKSE